MLAVVIDVIFVRRASNRTHKRLYMYALAHRIDSIGVSVAYRRILISGTCHENLFSYWTNDGEKGTMRGHVNEHNIPRRRRFKLSKCVAL